jgi:hypothetical protein
MDPCERASADFEPLLKVFGYFASHLAATYLSAPINSGWRFIKWYETVGVALKQDPNLYRRRHQVDVTSKNIAQAASVAARLREEDPQRVVIDPTAFEFKAWTQDDYRCFWSKVIERFAIRVVFVGGWEASVGCIYEFKTATMSGKPTLNESGAVINIDNAISKIQAAACEMKRVGIQDRLFEATVCELQRIVNEDKANG